MRNPTGAAAACFALILLAGAAAAQPARPWMDPKLDPDTRARLLDQKLTPEERLGLLHGPMALPFFAGGMPPGALGSAGYIAGVPRLGVPALQESDASLGVTNPAEVRKGDGGTALPSGLAMAAAFDADAAYRNGRMIGREAWAKGLNVMLAGGANLARDPRNGRNFEYLGEDPLLTGTLAGEAIAGIQSQNVVSTTKHFAINDQETLRQSLSSRIDWAAARESDLLAFQIAIERGRPGSVMCAYNRVNGVHACDSDALLNGVLKGAWGYKGWVMSDWGAVPGVEAAAHGLDQQSGEQIDKEVYFDDTLLDAVKAGKVKSERVSDMSRRVLRSMFAVGLFDHPARPGGAVDMDADALVAQAAAEDGMVLLKNRGGILPLAREARRIAVIGGHADAGVLSGGGSSQVLPPGGTAIRIPVGGEGQMAAFRAMIYHPSSPLKAIRAAVPNAEVRYDDGAYPSAAAALAKDSDLAIVFVTQWMIEGYDAPDLTLPNGQDQLVAAVTAANPNTIVVLETGGPVLMPWLDKAAAVLEAWYPGARGGEAIARVLFGEVSPSGRLPVTFPADESQLPRPQIPGWGQPDGSLIDVDYDVEGSDVGYRWFARKGAKPLFPFGYGLSYTRFAYGGLKVDGGGALKVSFTVTNTGQRPGKEAPQVYLTSAAGQPELRLIGFSKLELKPGETRRVTLTADPRLLARFDPEAKGWRIAAGDYQVAVGPSSAEAALTGGARLKRRLIPDGPVRPAAARSTP